MIYYNNSFYEGLREVCEHEGWGKKDVESFPDDFTIKIQYTTYEPIETFSPKWITDRIDDERFSEAGVEKEVEKIRTLLSEDVDFDYLNSVMPKLYYNTGIDKFITKQQLLDAI